MTAKVCAHRHEPVPNHSNRTNIRFLSVNSHWAVPGPPSKNQTGRNLLARLRIGRHGLGRPPKIRFQRRPEARVVREGCVVERLGEANLRSFIHFDMFSISRMNANHAGLISHRCSDIERATHALTR
jgi:hypothetical protein